MENKVETLFKVGEMVKSIVLSLPEKINENTLHMLKDPVGQRTWAEFFTNSKENRMSFGYKLGKECDRVFIMDNGETITIGKR